MGGRIATLSTLTFSSYLDDLEERPGLARNLIVVFNGVRSESGELHVFLIRCLNLTMGQNLRVMSKKIDHDPIASYQIITILAATMSELQGRVAHPKFDILGSALCRM